MMMRTMKLAIAAITIAGAVQFNAHAEGVAIGLGAGTAGLGPQVVFGLPGDRINLRFGGSGLAYSTDYRRSGVDYDIKWKMGNAPLIVDWFPTLRFPLRVSGGLFGHFNRADVEARPSSGTYEIGTRRYDANEIGRVSGWARYRTVAPYLGAGWGNAVAAGKNWSWNVDAGLLYVGKPKTSYSVTCGAAISAARCTQLQNDAAIEAAEFDREMKDERLYPIIQFWMGKKF